MLRGIVPHQKGGVKPLISLEEWQQAQRLLKHRATTRTSSTKLNIFCLAWSFAILAGITVESGHLRTLTTEMSLRSMSLVWTRHSR